MSQCSPCISFSRNSSGAQDDLISSGAALAYSDFLWLWPVRRALCCPVTPLARMWGTGLLIGVDDVSFVLSDSQC